jgi:ABC-type taurine transport system ATPase subunit
MQSGEHNIIKNYNIDFTNRLLINPKEKVAEDKNFIKLKLEILELLED